MIKAVVKFSFFIILLYSCGVEEKETEDQNPIVEVAQTGIIENTEEGEFAQFLAKFSDDTTFQKNHIHFPLKYDVFVKDELKLLYIEKSDWLVVDLSSESDLEPMERKVTVENDTAKVEFIGMVTPTFNGYLFTKDSSGWQLEMFSDYTK